jgi:hypothetical protein
VVILIVLLINGPQGSKYGGITANKSKKNQVKLQHYTMGKYWKFGDQTVINHSFFELQVFHKEFEWSCGTINGPILDWSDQVVEEPPMQLRAE